jgi:hypothetical protein
MECVHNIHFGVEPTFGNNIPYENKLISYWDYTESKTLYTDLYSKVTALKFNIEEDSDTIECSSKKYTFKINDLKPFFSEYNKLKNIMLKEGFKPSTCYKEIENEGGCHIHLSTLKIKRLNLLDEFLYNLHIFFINNPELSWLFNNPHDNEIFSPLALNNLWHDGIRVKRLNINDHLKNNSFYLLSKNSSILYRRGYDTIEFRLFMMPRNNDEFRLHLNLVVAIYNYIFKLTKNKIKLKSKYKLTNNPKNIFINHSFKNAYNNIFETFNDIGLSKKDINLIKKIKLPFMKFRYKHDEYYKLHDEKYYNNNFLLK